MLTTAAEAFAANMSSVAAVRPAAFIVNGQNTAAVLDNGQMQLYPMALSVAQARLLLDWIKLNYVQGGPPA